MDQPDSRHEQVRQVQLLLATQLAHVATIATVKAIEELTSAQEEMDLENLRPSVSASEFLEVMVFCCFCMGMLGRYRRVPARNYILDSLFLFLGNMILRLRGIDAAREFERVRVSRLTRYMNHLNNLFGDQQNANRGFLTDLLIADFETEVLKRPFPALKSVLRECILAEELVAKRDPEGLWSALQVDLGRNGSSASITAFLKNLISLNELSREGNKFEHIEQTGDIIGVYLQENRLGSN